MHGDDPTESDLEAILAIPEFADLIGVGLVVHGPDGSIIAANTAACVLLGLTRDQILGRTSMDSRWGAVHEDGSPFPGEEHPAMVTLRTGEPCTDVVMGVDATGFERRWLEIGSIAVDLPERGVVVVASFVDANDRVRAARAHAETSAELTRSEALYRVTVDVLLDPHVLLDAVRDASGSIVDFVVVDANDAACVYNLTSRDELIGIHLLERFPGAAGVGLLDACAQVIETGVALDLTDYRYDHEILREERLYDIHAANVGDTLSCTWRDVTEDRVRSDAVARAQEMVRTKLDAMLDPQAYLEPIRDHAGRIVDFVVVDANRAMVESVDAGSASLTGTRLTEAFPGATESGFLGMCAHVQETGEPLALDGLAVAGVAPDAPERCFDVRGVGVADGISLTWRDVTDRVAAQDELSEREERYRMLAEHTTDAIFQIDLDGTIAWASEGSRVMLGWTPDEIIGLRNVDLVHPEDLSWFRVETARLATTGGTARFTIRVLRADGSWCWVEAVSSQVDRSGRPPFRAVRLRDVNHEVEALRRLAESERRYRLLAENSSDVIIHLVDKRIAWVSPSVERVFGWQPDAVKREGMAGFVHPDDVELSLDALRRAGDGETVVERLRVRSADGDFHWIEVHGGPFVDEDGVTEGALAIVHVVDAEVAAFLALDRLAHFDPVTGVVNRAEALQRLDDRLGDRRRRGPFGVLYCDVDRFKDVNDALGHAVGDLVLRTLAQRFTEALRADDTVARLGGDEFVVILEGPIGLDDATRVAEKLRRAALEVISDGEVAYSASISIGVTVDRDSDDADSLLARADGAMYEAKSGGRNRVVAVR